MNQLLVAVDGNSLMHRAFHAIGDLDDGHGNPTNAIYGFTGMLLKVLLEREPSHLVVAFDMHGPTFRHEAYDAYKGTRKPTDESLRSQFPRVKEMLQAMGIAIIEVPRFEADDILGTLASRCEEAGMQALLVTGDRDALQLVTEKTHVLYTKRGISETIEFDPETVQATYGVSPVQIPDLKGLMGDASDNIPGVPGVGEKTAVKLLAEYGTVTSVLQHAQEQKGKLRERLIEHKRLAEQSLWLATISKEAPLPISIDDAKLSALQGAAEAFSALGFRSLLPRIQKLQEIYASQTAPIAGSATSFASNEQSNSERKYDEPLLLETKEAIADYLRTAAVFALHWDGKLTLATETSWARIPLREGLLWEGLLESDTPATTMLPEDAFDALSPLFASQNALRLFDAKRLLHIFDSMQLSFNGFCVLDDALLAGWLLNPLTPPKTLQALASNADARALFTLCDQQQADLTDQGMSALYRDVEMPLMRVLLDMERTGFLVDKEALDKLGEKFTAMQNALSADIIALTGGIPFNLNSPKQLGEVLFERLGLPTGRKTKSGYSTDAETLEGLQDKHPAIAKLLEYRQVTKLNATYIDGLRQQIDTDGRVRSSFDQTATVTGRLSSNEPNLQNIPIRTPMGRDIRRAFIAREGWTLVDADYSQIELRILAHLSQDEGMMRAFLQNEDVHRRTAADVYGVPPEAVTAAMRSAAKAVNFGIVYGISDFGLAKNIGVSRKEAGEFIARYFEKYPGVRRFMDKAVADGKTLGYAETLLGRRRPLPELTSGNFNTRSFGERAAMNTPVQGAAADIIKLAMVRVHRELAAQGYAAKLILQVHDELIVECPEVERESVQDLLAQCMEQVMTLHVPLIADVHYGKTWYDAK